MASQPPRKPAVLAPVESTATASVVLAQLRRAIGLGRFQPGDRLPPERSLAAQLGVARGTLRSALRVLSRDGVVEIRRGAHGGIIVRTDAQELGVGARTAEEIDNNYAFRLANERAAARLAALRRTAADLRRLDGLLELMARLTATAAARRSPTNVATFIAADVDFHLAIAAAARHPWFEQTIEQALAHRYLPFGTIFTALHDDANDGHREILAAIAAGNAAAAERAMARHIQSNYRVARRLVAAR